MIGLGSFVGDIVVNLLAVRDITLKTNDENDKAEMGWADIQSVEQEDYF